MLGSFSASTFNAPRQPLKELNDTTVAGYSYGFDAKSDLFRNSLTVRHNEDINSDVLLTEHFDAQQNGLNVLTQQGALSRIAYSSSASGVYRPSLSMKSASAQPFAYAEFDLKNGTNPNGATNWMFYMVYSGKGSVGLNLSIARLNTHNMYLNLIHMSDNGAIRFNFGYNEEVDGSGIARNLADGGADLAGAPANFADPDSIFMFVFRRNPLGLSACTINLANLSYMYYTDFPEGANFNGDGSYTVVSAEGSKLHGFEAITLKLGKETGSVPAANSIDFNLHSAGILTGSVGGAEKDLINLMRRRWWYSET